MFQLSYSTNGLTHLDLFSAISEVSNAGYQGIELTFQEKQFDPFKITHNDLMDVKRFLRKQNLKAACISTPTICLLSDRPHDPSLLTIDNNQRQKRIDLIKKGIEIAEILEAPVVTFGSGFIREEHVLNPTINPREILVDSIRECLKNIANVTLVIEPEPGMYIETLAEGVSLVKTLDSENFKLHLDLCHAYCSEHNYINAIIRAAPFIKYLHISDTTDGYNLKFIQNFSKKPIDSSFSGCLIYDAKKSNFLFIDKKQMIYFYHDALIDTDKISMISTANGMNQRGNMEFVCYDDINRSTSIYDSEINAYLNSIPGVSFAVLDQAKPVLRYLRDKNKHGKQYIEKKLCNTITGKVHYHDIPGNGDMDFSGIFNALTNRQFAGYATVELYNHNDIWNKALTASIKYLQPLIRY